MKTFKTIIAASVFLICNNSFAQTLPPAPPAPPAAPLPRSAPRVPSPPAPILQDENTSRPTNSSNVAIITQTPGKGLDRGGNTSFSVSNSSNVYRIKSKFPSHRYPAVREYLEMELGQGMATGSNTEIHWSMGSGSVAVYEIDLDKGKLKLHLDKENASEALVSKFQSMGEVLRELISGDSEEREIMRIEREAERAQRNAERMRREAERLKAMSNRRATRIAQEADRLLQEAQRLSHVSKRSGGIDGYVKELLGSRSTIYSPNAAENLNWKWPQMYTALLHKLTEDGLLKLDASLVFVKDPSGIYVNGTKLTKAAAASYDALLIEHDYEFLSQINVYSKASNLVVVNNAFDLENVLIQLNKKGLLPSKMKATTVALNGNSVVIDGQNLHPSEVAQWNMVLHDLGIVPAPGKTLVIEEDKVSLGYTLGERTLGTFMSLN